MIFESEYGIMINDDIEYEQRERYYLTLLVLYVGHFFIIPYLILPENRDSREIFAN